jgi:hypothetical protein
MRKAQASHMTAQTSHMTDRAREGNAEMTRVPNIQLSEQISSMKLIVVTKKMKVTVTTRF